MEAQSEVLRTYLRLMNTVKLRYNAIRLVQAKKDYKTPYQITQIEFCVLQIRKMLETIALGSLVANRELYSSYYNNLDKMWNGRLMLKDMERLNPEFYPKPITVDISKEPHDLVNKTEGYLTKADYIDIYDKCGKLLHSESPFVSDKENEIMYKSYEESLYGWCGKIIGLLNTHLIYLADGKTMLYVTMQTNDKDIDYPAGNVFKQIEEDN